MDFAVLMHFLNWFLMIALPILLGIFLINKSHLNWKLWLIGAATFLISQIFHIPFNTYILNPILQNIQQALPGVLGTLVVAILLGLSAGIFEECARYGMFRWWIRNARSWWSAILTGAGHGGIESIILGCLVMLGFINLMAYRNTDLSNLNLAPLQLLAAHQQIQLYWNLPWYDSLLGAVERIFTIPFHIAASVIVLQVFTRKPGQRKHIWLILAILYHAIMDSSIVFIAGQWNGYAAEAILAIMAILDIIIIFALRQPEPEPPAQLQHPDMDRLLVFTPTPIEETSENLENTRYQ
jgi:uncharacterized membrane protein YhfC